MTTFPGTIDSFTAKTDSVDDVMAAHINDLQAAVEAIETELGTDPAGSKTDLKTRLAVALANDGTLRLAASTILTIASGAITLTQNWHRIAAEGGAASDNLDTISGLANDGEIVFLRPSVSSTTINIRNGIDNIVCVTGSTIALTTTSDFAIGIYDANLSKWIVGRLASGIEVTATAAAADNQVSVFTSSTNVEGTSALTFDGTTLATTGGLTVNSGSASAAGYDTTIYGDTKTLFWADASADIVELGDVAGGNYAKVASDGTVTLVGTATAWDDLRIEPVARTTGSNAPTFEKYYDDAAGTSRGVYLYSFDDAAGGSEKEIFFTMQMPHSWAQTSINMHVHWVGAVADTTSAPRWGLEYIWQEIGGTYGDTTIVYSDGSNYTAVGTDADITANKHYISKFAALNPGTGADGISSILIGRLFRDSANAGDTYNAGGAKCGLLYIDAHYEVNSFGSSAEYTK